MNKWLIARHVFEVLSATGTVLGAWALIRTYLLSRSRLVVLQQSRFGKNYVGWMDGRPQIGISVLVCNPRSQPNAIVDWQAQVKQRNGQWSDVPVPSGELVGGNLRTPYGVIPLVIPAFGAVEASLCLYQIPKDTPVPMKLKLVATDVLSKKHQVQCVLTEKQSRGGDSR